MATARKLDSGAWRCRPTKVIDGKKVTKSFTVHPKDCANNSRKAKEKAELLAKQWLLEQEEQTGDVTVSAAIDQYIAGRSAVLSQSTIADYYRMKKHFADLVDLNVSAVDTKAIQSLINEMAMNRLSTGTIKNRISFLLSALDYAGCDKKFKLRYPQRIKPELNPPEKNEYIRLLEIATKEQKVVLMLAGLYTMRRGEVCALTGKDILWDMHSIYIHSSMVQDKDKNWIRREMPKNLNSVRTVQLDPDLMELLPRVGKDDPVVEMNPNQVTKMFERLRKKACVTCRFHDLRKYAASVRSEMMPSKYVESDGGWRKDSQVLKTIYDKPFKESRKEYSKKFNDQAKSDYGDALLG